MNESIKVKADKIRIKILACSDIDLVHFGHAVFAGEARADPFEPVEEFIERVARENVDSLPF